MYAPTVKSAPRVTRIFAFDGSGVHVSLVHSLARLKRRLTVVICICTRWCVRFTAIGCVRGAFVKQCRVEAATRVETIRKAV